MITQEKRIELTRKFMNLLENDGGIDEESMGLIGAFDIALCCAIDDGLIDKLLETQKTRTAKVEKKI